MEKTIITLSRVEQVCLGVHLETQARLLSIGTEDRIILQGVLIQVRAGTVLTVTQLETVVVLRYVRNQIRFLTTDIVALEEQILRGGFDGSRQAAHRALDTERQMLEDIARRLWQIVL